MSEALEKVAAEHGIESVTAIALAYLLTKSPFVFPIIGGRKIEHLYDNIQALKIKLTDEQVQYLEGIVPFDPGFPWSFVSRTIKIALMRGRPALSSALSMRTSTDTR